MAIQSFRHKGLKEFFIRGSKKGIRPDHAGKLADILDRLDGAAVVYDMDYPGSCFHSLKGGLEGYWSVKVSENWRVTFQFKDGDAYDVAYVDYH